MRRFVLALIVVLAVGARHDGASGRLAPLVAAERVPVLVELFTSEGCSDCPPADALLERLIATQPVAAAEVIAISEHVDYWDRLGWKDRFSSGALTARQQAYSRAFGMDSIYTPQMVVAGRTEFVGSDERLARKAIEHAAGVPRGRVALAVDGTHVRVDIAELPAGTERADVVVVVTEDRLTSDVRRGENKGRVLKHAAVARYLATIGQASASAPFTRAFDLPLAADWQRPNLKVVAFVQEASSRSVLAVASTPLGPARP